MNQLFPESSSSKITLKQTRVGIYFEAHH